MTGWRAALWPCSVLYEAIVRLRTRLYRAGILHCRRLEATVISVGNLTVGGTGKTPMVLYLAEHLYGEGKRVAVLTRGYRGKDGRSDEVDLLRGRLRDRVKLGVGADRFRAGRDLPGVDYFILDDGFQHLQLARDVNLVLLDAGDPFGGGHMLPSGRLREPKAALARADIIVITRSSHSPALESIVRRLSAAPVFYAQTVLEGVFKIQKDSGGDLPFDARGKRMYAFSAIGNPAAFLEDLKRWGVALVGEMRFRDHHRYTAGDLVQVERRALTVGAEGLICTEKDVFNLPQERFSRLPAAFCRIGMQIGNEREFWEAVHFIGEHNSERIAR